MAKVNNKTKGFGSIPRDVVYDNELSDRARFVYVYMACKPEGWEFYQDKVAEELGYGKDTLRKYLDELIIRGWLTENEQQNDGKFGCLEYDIEIERINGNIPIRKKTDTEKTRNGKIPNQRDIDNISSKHSLSDNKEIKSKKEFSNDNPKKEAGISFSEFYKNYPVKKSVEVARKAWNRLSIKDKEAAYNKLPEYLADCARCNRNIKHPSTYIHQRTWEDDFTCTGKIRFYDPIEGDSDEKIRFKKWMRKDYPELENCALPLSYEDYMSLLGDGYKNVEEVNKILNDLHYDIYMYRKSDIASVIRQKLSDPKYEQC